MTVSNETGGSIYPDGAMDRDGGIAAAPAKLNYTSVVSHVAFITCICLQRFGIPFGGGTLSISLPVFFLLILWMIVSGRAQVPPKNALFYLFFFIWAVLSAFAGLFAPDPRVGFSILSLIELLILYMLLTVRPAGDFDGAIVQGVFLFYSRLCAVLGILQFLLQFIGIRLFSFGVLVPSLNPWLLEKDFAWNPILKYGSNILRSNGFFLLEPSIFSQIIALAVLLDVFILGRRRYLPLYLIAYMTSYSGTGLLILVITLALVGVTSVKNTGRVLAIGVVGAITLGIFALVFPSQVSTYMGRFTELNSTQSSGYARYVAQTGEIQAFAGETRSLLGYGPGATARSKYWTSGSGNAALQLFVDYGLVGLVLFYVFLVNTLWRTRYAAMSIMLLITFQLGGGYLLLPPIILLMAALGVWAASVPAASRRQDTNWAGVGFTEPHRVHLPTVTP